MEFYTELFSFYQITFTARLWRWQSSILEMSTGPKFPAGPARIRPGPVDISSLYFELC